MCLFAVEPKNQLGCVTSDVVTVQILALWEFNTQKITTQKSMRQQYE